MAWVTVLALSVLYRTVGGPGTDVQRFRRRDPSQGGLRGEMSVAMSRGLTIERLVRAATADEQPVVVP